MNPFTRLAKYAISQIRAIPGAVGGIAKMVARRLGRAVSRMGGTLSQLGDAIEEGAAGTVLAEKRADAAFSHLIHTREPLFGALDPMDDVPSKLILYRDLPEDFRYSVTWKVEKFYPATGATVRTYVSSYFDEAMVPDDWFAELEGWMDDDPRYAKEFIIQSHQLALVQQNPNWTGTVHDRLFR